MSSSVRKTTALASLTATYSDSESEEHDEEYVSSDDKHAINKHNLSVINIQNESRTNSPISYLSIESLVKKNDASKEVNNISGDTFDDEYNDTDDNACNVVDDTENAPNSPISYHRSLFGKTEEELVIPCEPSERCSVKLQEKIAKLHEKMQMGHDMNTIIQKRKDFRNPSIYEKLIAYCGIDELATNYPPNIYDPYKYGPESYYDELSKRQKEEMEKREREKKEKTKVEFITGTKKVHNDSGSDNSMKKKSKWDMPSGSNNSSNASASQVSSIRPQIVIPVTAPSGTKPTVISAFGTIGSKKSK